VARSRLTRKELAIRIVAIVIALSMLGTVLASFF
jgi:hypothetical protein